VLDDLEPERKLTIFQQSADATIGEIRAPRIDPVDTARIECERFVAAARATGSDPSSRRAVTVVGVLESLNASIGRGRPAVAERFETPSRPHLNVVPLRALKR
jgi:hypothetical protein